MKLCLYHAELVYINQIKKDGRIFSPSRNIWYSIVILGLEKTKDGSESARCRRFPRLDFCSLARINMTGKSLLRVLIFSTYSTSPRSLSNSISIVQSESYRAVA